MYFGMMDIVIFVAFVISVVTVGIMKSRDEKTGEDYFLAGRGLTWWLIGFSLIAANISTEQFVGMSGNAASHVGLAIASYEWLAAVTLVVVAFGFLPYFLKAGIFTMPQFLEYRFNAAARTIMAVATLFIYLLLLGSVTYSGALTIKTLAGNMGYSISLGNASLVIGLIAMAYVVVGGLKACAWADLIQGSALILGGAVIMFFAFKKLGIATEAAQILDVNTGAIAIKSLTPDQGSLSRFFELNRVRLNMFLPSTDMVLPATALALGLWIPNFYYWGLNQYITQRTLGSASLSEGQKGIVFAAFLKLIIPFVIVVPGIIAFNLYDGNMQNEAAKDNTVAMVKYLKANPQTQVVTVADKPDEATVSSDAVKKISVKNPFVLPIEKAQFDAVSVAANTIFASDDKAWANVYPDLANEVKAYNAQVLQAGKITTTEKFLAYKYDTALAQLLGNVLPQGFGIIGFVLAALLGAVVSSLAAMLNAASTIFTIDIYQKYMAPKASQQNIVLLGRICVVVCAVVAVFLAPQLGNPKFGNSIFTILQEAQGFISPGILAVFVFGLLIRKAPHAAGAVGLITNILSYGVLKVMFPQIQFLNRMAVCFGFCIVVMAVMTLIKALPQPVVFDQKVSLDLKSSKGAVVAGIVVVAIAAAFYILFSPIGIAR
jgi:SSS family solute:Na+ symporter